MLHAPALCSSPEREACARYKRCRNSVQPREHHRRPHETAQPARSMRLAVRGLRLVNSVVLACLARLPYRTGGHGPRESGQSRTRGHRSVVGACQHCPRSVHTDSASDLSEGLQGLLAVQRAAAAALMVIVAEAIAPGAPMGALSRRLRCRAGGASAACTERGALNAQLAVCRNVWPA